MRIRIPMVVVAVLTAASLAGCTAAASSSAAGGGSSSVDFQSTSGRMPAAKAAAADRAVVTTGSLRLVTAKPIAAAGRVTDLVEAAGGLVARSEEDPSGRASASLQLRIPAAAFQRTLDEIEREGEVRDVSIDSTDVTAQVTDQAVRIANLRTSIARLRSLLRTASSSSALVEIEGALTDRQGKLEQLLTEQRSLADRVTYATLSVSIVVPAAVPKAGPADFLSGVVAGTHGLGVTVAALAVGLGVALPWLVVLAALGGAGVLVRRALRRRTRPTAA